MMPSPPALDTAEASGLRAIQPIGACTIGYATPVWASTRFILVFLSSSFTSPREAGRWRVAQFRLCDTASAGIRHNIAQFCQEPCVIAGQNNTFVPAGGARSVGRTP